MADENSTKRYSSETELRAIQIRFDHLERKVENMEKIVETVGALAQSVQKHAYILESTQKEIIKMGVKIDTNQKDIFNLRLAPASKWEKMKDRILWLVIGGFLLAILDNILKGVIN